MKLTVLNSGSRANGYILQNDTEALVLECGVGISECQKALGYNTKKVVGAFVTHEHGDHSKYVEKYLPFMPVFASLGTAQAINDKLKGVSRVKELKCLKWQQFGSFKVMPFDTQHDCIQPTGYLIKHEEIGLLLFATDTYYLRYKFEGLTNVMIECNYVPEVLERNVSEGVIHPMVSKRTERSHMSLDTCISTLCANDLTKVAKIILLHLSNQNADGELMVKEVTKNTGKVVYIAKKGLEVELNQTLF